MSTHVWLILRNDLRLTWRELRGNRLRSALMSGLIVLFLLVGHAAVGVLCWAAPGPPPEQVEAILWAFFTAAMLGIAVQQSLAVLFVRGDVDLLLASPLSPRALLIARLGAITIASGAGVALFIPPLLNSAAIFFSSHYVLGYLTWGLLAIHAAVAGLTITLLLVRCFGLRRGRLFAQVAGALLGASVYVATQAPMLLPHGAGQRLTGWLSAVAQTSWFTLPARAARGDGGALVALALSASIVLGVAAVGLERTLWRGAQSVDTPRRRRRSRRIRQWVSSPFAVAVWKDVRLIARDPLLLAQILPAAVYLLPAAFAGWRLLGGSVPALVSVIIAGQFASLFTRVAADGEECWDLILGSPANERQQRLAKLAAGLVAPMLLATALCVLAGFSGFPGVAAVAWVLSLAVAAGCARVQVATIVPTVRRDIFKRRRGGSWLGAVLNLLLVGTGTTAVVLSAKSHWAIAATGVAATLVAVALCFMLVRFKETQFDRV